MRITLTGGSGFIGRRLAAALEARGHALHLLGRSPKRGLPPGAQFTIWDAASIPPPAAMEDADAVIHLAGEPVSQRWTAEVKRRIRASRVDSTTCLIEGIRSAARPSGVLVCASAIGYYGDRGEEPLTESSAPGSGFLPEVCVEWENAASQAAASRVRVILVRTGVVLHPEGGALRQMLPPFRWGVGGKLGSGEQWMSWIHMDDLVNLFIHAVEKPGLAGPLNAVSPNPVRNAEFTQALARAVRRPALLPVPAAAIRLLFGEMAQIVLASQRVLPEAVLAGGFEYAHPSAGPALEQLLNPGRGAARH
jgi:uncharacterized protein (TIGR01777 family)